MPTPTAVSTAAAAPDVLAVVPVSAAGRLAYVWRHFALNFENAAGFFGLIGATGSGAAVEVADSAAGFFERQLPHPPPPVWREIRGHKIPFFFDDSDENNSNETNSSQNNFGRNNSRKTNSTDNNSTKNLPLVYRSNTVFISADIIAASFYFLSGWQEYFSSERDPHGRFPYAASIQKKYDCATLPLVNYYFDVLRLALEHASGQKLRPRRWGAAQAAWAACITHDVDSLRGGWGTALRHALRHGRFGAALRLAAQRATGRPAPWHNLTHVRAQTARYGAPSTFFVLAETRAAPHGPPNADYDATAPDVAATLQALAATGAEIALHGSYGTAQNPARLTAETRRLLPLRPTGNRFHYLCWEPRTTPATVAAAGFAYDSTLGFAEQFGFRNAYCHPFHPWDFENGRALAFLEIPLVLMDTTLHHPHYLQLKSDEIMPTISPVLDEIRRFGGVFTLLWHNANFDPLNLVNGPGQFHEIMAELGQNKAAFLSGNEIARAFNSD